MTNAEYRMWLIKEIVNDSSGLYTEEELRKKPIKTLERIYDNL